MSAWIHSVLLSRPLFSSDQLQLLIISEQTKGWSHLSCLFQIIFGSVLLFWIHNWILRAVTIFGEATMIIAEETMSGDFANLWTQKVEFWKLKCDDGYGWEFDGRGMTVNGDVWGYGWEVEDANLLKYTGDSFFWCWVSSFRGWIWLEGWCFEDAILSYYRLQI